MTVYFIFGFIALIHLLSISHSPWQSLTKGLLMPSVALVYFTVHAGAVNVLLICGLAFGYIGDLLLIRDKKPRWFLSGLLMFFCGHIFYILALADQIHWSMLSRGRFFLSLFYLPFLVAIILYLKKDAGKMLPAIVLYSIVLSLMSTAALFRWLSGGSALAFWAFPGSVLFLISDGILSIDHFRKRLSGSFWVVMSTYIAAQFLIVFSFIR